MPDAHSKRIYTVGHSTRSIEAFIALLKTYKIEVVADIRIIPRSRYNPHYNDDALAASLPGAGIGYRCITALGGKRKAHKDSANTGWKNASFRGYADYMQTPEFHHALGQLIALAEKKCTAIMCAEILPWRCHRSLVADALLVHGIEVVDILSEKDYKLHSLTPFAHVSGLEITYPHEEEEKEQMALF